MSRLAELEQARLLDWRFLLPDVLAGTWALTGQVPQGTASAMEALHGCTAAVGHAATDRELDGVIARDPDVAELLGLLEALRPGGLVYVEASRRRTRPATLRGWQALLSKNDVDVVERHWHAPDFAARTRMVPLEGRAGVLDTLRRHDGMRFGRLLALGGRCALRLGLLDVVVPCGSVVGRRR